MRELRTEDWAATQRTNDRLDRVHELFDRVVPFRGARPLDGIGSLKAKLSIVIVAAVLTSITAVMLALALGLGSLYGVAVALLLALAMVNILARGMTRPLREMTAAADRMAGGDYEQVVAADSADEIGRLGRSFNEMAAHIVELEAQRRDLLANVSHELRTPIAVLQASIENLQDGVGSPDAGTLDVMHRQVTRLGRLVTQLLDLSRLESGMARLQPEPTDLVGVLQHVIDEAMLRVPPPTILFEGPEVTIVDGDAERLHQVFANLLDNAIAHGPANEPVRISVSTRDGRAVVQVVDGGPGIPDAIAARIFDRYVGAAHPNAVSNGLGLAIAHSIVEHHRGTIDIAPPPAGGGCCFEVTLPTAPLIHLTT